MRKNTSIYFIIVSIFGVCLWQILERGRTLETLKLSTSNFQFPILQKTGSLLQDFAINVHHPLTILLLQILIIIIAARLLGWLMVKIGQPTVIGEIIAGILLGPSLMGWWLPNFSAFLFPLTSVSNLQFLSQIGLILFMFVIGMELDLDTLKKSAKDALVISHAGIIFSYFLGVCLAYFLYQTYAPPNIPFLAFGLFMGNAMSITAFPVLARIIQERGLTRTAIGILVISCAAIDDITAWCILAVVIAVVKAGSIGGSFLTIIFSAIYLGLMIYLVRPFLNRLANRFFSLETLSKPIVAFIFIILLVSSYSTEVIGIHALFGAFIAGVVMPSKAEFRHVFTNKIEDISQVLLLPLFFVLTGLRTQIGLLNDTSLWGMCALIIAVAITGKFLGTGLTARLMGQSWRNSFIIGTLMNTRGLMELVVLNIGYDLGILSPTLFSMFVLMALITTFITGPALDLINYFSREDGRWTNSDDRRWTMDDGKTTADIFPSSIENPSSIVHRPLSVLISFGQPKAGERLLQLADELCWADRNISGNIHALHLTPSADISITEATIFEKEGFTPILAEARERDIILQTHYKATNNLNQEIIRYANNGNFNLMLVGSSRPLFSDDETGGKVHEFFGGINCPIGVLIDRGFSEIKNVLVIQDDSPINIADLLKKFREKNNVIIISPENLGATVKNFNLVAINLSAWEKIRATHRDILNNFPSVLIIG